VGSQAIAFASLHIYPQTKNKGALKETAISTFDQDTEILKGHTFASDL
jgi:hypothetical protein